MHYLYRITNQVNNKVYIGQTSKNPPSQRWAQHCYEARQGNKKHLYSSIRKYTRDNFRFEIISMCKNQEDADYLESELIKQYDSLNQNKGYNLTPAGTPNMSGFKHSDETKQLWSKQRKGIRKSPNTEFKKGSEGNLISHQAWNKGKSNPIKLTVEQISLIQQDNRSASLIAKDYGVHKTTILYHKKKVSLGYICT